MRWFRKLLSGDQARWLPFRLGAHVAVMIAVAACVAWVVWSLLGGRLPQPTTSREHIEVAKLVLGITAGLGGIVALVVAYRKQGISEAAEKREEAAQEREDNRAFSERFASASEQLSSDKVANRLAGVYSMAHLADDWQTGRQTCIDVLCAYIRMPYEVPENPSDPENRSHVEEGHVRQIIMDVVSDRLRPWSGSGKSWQGCAFNFRGATIHAAVFDRIVVSDGTVLDFASVAFDGWEIRFRSMECLEGTLNFFGASFRRDISFRDSWFRDGASVSFMCVNFGEGIVDFRNIVVENATVDFTEASFETAVVRFDSARFSGGNVLFAGTQLDSHAETGSISLLEGVMHFDYAEFEGAHVEFRGARFSNKTRLDFGKVRSWLIPPYFDTFSDQPLKGLILPVGGHSE